MQGIIDSAASELLRSFREIQDALDRGGIDAAGTGADHALLRAMTALQFQDMTGQLISGLRARITCASGVLDRATAGELLQGNPAGEIFPRQIVLQANLAPGSIDLF